MNIAILSKPPNQLLLPALPFLHHPQWLAPTMPAWPIKGLVLNEVTLISPPHTRWGGLVAGQSGTVFWMWIVDGQCKDMMETYGNIDCTQEFLGNCKDPRSKEDLFLLVLSVDSPMHLWNLGTGHTNSPKGKPNNTLPLYSAIPLKHVHFIKPYQIIKMQVCRFHSP